MNKKYIITTIVLVVAAVIIIPIARKIEINYCYNHPVYEITYFVSDGEKAYKVRPSFFESAHPKSKDGVNPDFKKEWRELASALNAVQEVELKYTVPLYLVGNIELKDGKTVISMSGKATNKDGEVEDVYVERVLDYEIRAKFPKEQSFESKYWNPDLTRK